MSPRTVNSRDSLKPNLSAKTSISVYLRNWADSESLCRSKKRRLLVSGLSNVSIFGLLIKVLRRSNSQAGNQQKLVIAKSLVQNPELIIFDEPTRGVDVNAITEIHQLINQLADEGKAVVVISPYLPEVMALSDRILVSRMGKVVEEFSALEATEEKIMYAAIH